MAFDTARILVKAGDGGAGAISMRREKFVPQGGPDGGDGGRGGSIYLVAESGSSTLQKFERQRHVRADAGGKGSGGNRHGKKGGDLRLPVPAGTLVYDDATGDLIVDLAATGQETMIGRGGRGGLGNSHFATSTNQAPRMAQKGEPGEERWIRLVLKLIADVGIVGFPNVGKSTLLAAVSRANPKVADYPFTTLEPNLGVVDVGWEQFVLADIPGLIEGAHRGVGLGHSFLRHVERTRVLIHLLDGSQVDPDPYEAFDLINAELEMFDAALRQKPQIVTINKIDLPEVRDRLPELTQRFADAGVTIRTISAATGEGVSDVMVAALAMRNAVMSEELERDEIAHVPVLRPAAADIVRIVPDGNAYRITGRRVERAVAMTDLQNDEALAFLWRVFDRIGVRKELEKRAVGADVPLVCGKWQIPRR
jgi:GTP-binding protein